MKVTNSLCLSLFLRIPAFLLNPSFPPAILCDVHLLIYSLTHSPTLLLGSGARSVFDAIEDDNEFIGEVGDHYKVKYFDILDLKIKFEVRNLQVVCRIV
jgi:hypothetical protein